MKDLPAPLRRLLQQARARLREAGVEPPVRVDESRLSALDRLLIASDYALEQLCRQPRLLAQLDASEPGLVLHPDAAPEWAATLRRYRHAASVRLIHRDVNGIDSLEATLAATSRLAERCLDAALQALQTQLEQEHGVPRSADEPQRMVVFGLGKLGGAELNFSSDVDLVFAYPASGHSDGARALDNNRWFQRLGQRLIQLLVDTDAQGMVYRVDMRLRPFGQAGRLALSFAAMEQYFQREGRDWERYAWIKARPVAGDLAQGERFLETLRPFIYRRYLDYGAFDGLREMKAMIDAEVLRHECEDNLKLGRGGIREIEFIVQLHQLIRAGREPELRVTGLLPALERLHDHGHIPAASAASLASAYRFLRRLENRLQMLREEQTHELPDDPLDRARLAFGMGFSDWDGLATRLQQHRDLVAREFARVFQAREKKASGSTRSTVTQLAALWRDPFATDAPRRLEQAGFADGAAIAQHLQHFARLPALATLSARARTRLDRVLPQLLAAAADSAAADVATQRGLALVQAVLRRSSYLSLLDEQPAALSRLVDVLAASRWMSDRLCAHPLLLDDLLDVRADTHPPTRSEVGAALEQALAGVPPDDTEARIHALNEFRQSFSFRVARERLIDAQPAPECARQLAFVAEAVVGAVLQIAIDSLAHRHGRLAGAGLAAIAYGSFGGKELGFDSDLDLVFLYDGVQPGVHTDGERPLEAMRYYTRVVQKVVTLLAMPTPAGSLYEADLRLRPDGGKGLLVSSVAAFAAYQHERAWTWEQQALVRARAVAGDAAVMQAFSQVRKEVLCRPRVPAKVAADARAMRARMRAELDRSQGQWFDLKQGEGGLVDLEFLLQVGVLVSAQQAPQVTTSTRTPALIAALADCGFFEPQTATGLTRAHDELCARALACTLDGRSRRVVLDDELEAVRALVREAWQRWTLAEKSGI